MNSEFLLEPNWPVFGSGVVSGHSKVLHEWCGKISSFVLQLSEKVKLLENRETEKNNELNKLKTDLETAKNSIKSTSISNEWVQVVKQGSKNAKKPTDQLDVANATISEIKEREKRRKNVIIHGVPESTKEVLTDKRAEDEQKIKEILEVIGKNEVKPAYSRRLRSKDSSKPGPILVELNESATRNPLLLAAKKLRETTNYKSVYISPDLTEAERKLDYELRKERNDLNSKLEENSPFRHVIRGNQIIKLKIKQ